MGYGTSNKSRSIILDWLRTIINAMINKLSKKSDDKTLLLKHNFYYCFNLKIPSMSRTNIMIERGA